MIAVSEPGSGLASSSHTNANRPNAAGQYPNPTGYRRRASLDPRPSVSSRHTVRTGEITRQMGPTITDTATSPTHSST